METLTAQQKQALRISRGIRLNIRLNWNRAPFHAIACRLWNQATVQSIPYNMVHGFLAVLD